MFQHGFELERATEVPSYNSLLWKSACWLGVRPLMPAQQGERDSKAAGEKHCSFVKIPHLHSCCLHHSRNALLKAAPAAAWCDPRDAAPGWSNPAQLLDWGCCLHLPVCFQANFGVWRSRGHVLWKIIVLQISKALKINIDRSEE